jgi:hypothetical protein
MLMMMALHCAGYRQLAKLSKLHHLRLVDAFPDGAQYGTNAGVATMTGDVAKGVLQLRDIGSATQCGTTRPAVLLSS